MFCSDARILKNEFNSDVDCKRRKKEIKWRKIYCILGCWESTKAKRSSQGSCYASIKINNSYCYSSLSNLATYTRLFRRHEFYSHVENSKVPLDRPRRSSLRSYDTLDARFRNGGGKIRTMGFCSSPWYAFQLVNSHPMASAKKKFTGRRNELITWLDGF